MRHTVICLVRHGQSIWQLCPSDDLDAPLTPVGHEQSKLTGRWLSDHHSVDGDPTKLITSVRVSPLRRALQTATYVCDGLGIQPVTQGSLLEAGFHVADHLPMRLIPLEEWEIRTASPPYLAFRAQVKEALSELIDASAAQNGEVLAVTHGAFIETALRLVIGNDAVRFPLCNASLTVLTWKHGRWHVPLLNFTGHLPSDLHTD